MPDFSLKVAVFSEEIWTVSFTNFSKEAENSQSNLLLSKMQAIVHLL